MRILKRRAALGAPEPGEWCHHCLLPSVWTTIVVNELDLGDGRGFQPLTIERLEQCEQCGPVRCTS